MGVGAALVAALAYNLLQVGLYGMFGPTLSGYLADKLGWNVSWWVWSLAAWLLVAGLGDPADGFPLTSLSPGRLFDHPGVGALLVTALLGYVGFEAAAVFSEEARAPGRTVPVAVCSGRRSSRTTRSSPTSTRSRRSCRWGTSP